MASKPGEVLIEFIPMGRFVKVVAVHPATLLEVSIVGDALEGQARLEQIAVRKLRYVLNKKLAGDRNTGKGDPSATAPNKGRGRGILV